MQNSIKTYSQDELEKLVASAGLPKFRSKQLLEWLYIHHVRSYDDMSNLPLSMRAFLAQTAPLTNAELVDKQTSTDGTRKYLFRLYDGALIETVGIPSATDANRLTVCFSTQSGCPMGCAFCATGQQDFTRNLGAGEMVDQILDVQEDFGVRVSNIVAMGQGEPFLNYDQVLSALRILNNPKGIAIGARKITVSTCGLLSGIRDFAQEPEQFTLAVSLHAARQNVRNDLMPGVRNYTLKDLRSCVASYISQTNRRVTFEYIMIQGVNDTQADLDALIDFCSGLLCHVNLLPINAVPDSAYKPSSEATIASWLKALDTVGIPATRRRSRGSDIAGACGQLKNTFTI